MKVLGVIPARYASSRFPGKPLVEILGTPMVVRVAQRTAEALGRDSVLVATDDERISRLASEHGFGVAMTSPNAPTGTDRVAEIARIELADVYVNVQGDEPMLDPDDIRRVVGAKSAGIPGVVNAMCRIGAEEDPESVNIPKVVAAEDGRLLYMSRRALPGSKDPAAQNTVYWRQVCVYAFERDDLLRFRAYGRRSVLEQSEDIEILRFLELQVPVTMVEVGGSTLAVDVPEDVARVEQALRSRGLA